MSESSCDATECCRRGITVDMRTAPHLSRRLRAHSGTEPSIASWVGGNPRPRVEPHETMPWRGRELREYRTSRTRHPDPQDVTAGDSAGQLIAFMATTSHAHRAYPRSGEAMVGTIVPLVERVQSISCALRNRAIRGQNQSRRQ
jgi:hypothetical protein